MSKQEYASHLKFGQGILIEGFKTDGKDKGFLTTQGFADIKAKYQTYDDLLYFKNYRNSIFEILPAGNFQLTDELQKALIENEGELEESSNIRILRNRAESEKKQFDLNIENNKKNNVCFGMNVIFRHVDSESYVSGTIKPSTGSNGAFTVQVSDILSESLVFKLSPFRSFEFMDMPIPFDSPILIQNVFNNGYMTFEKIGMGDQGKTRDTYIEKKPIESNDTYRIPVKTQSEKSDVYEVVTHFVDLSVEKEVPMPWRFKLQVNLIVNEILAQHDVVFLQHTENGGVLSTRGRDIILKELKEKTTNDLSFYECLWEIEKHIRNPDEKDDAYILRHLMSGMVLKTEVGPDNIRRVVLSDISKGKPVPQTEVRPQINEPVEGQENIVESHVEYGSQAELQGQIGFVEVKLAKKEGGEINSGSFVNIAWGEELLQTNDGEEQLQISLLKSQNAEGKIDQLAMRMLYKKEIEYNVRPLAFKRSVTQQHCFKIMEIEDELKKELLFALSFHSVIIRLREDLQWGAIEAGKKISYLRMMQVTTKIKEIKIFIKECSEADAQEQHILPVYKRQMICKDLGISELLFELLYFMKMNLKEDIFSDKHNEHDKFLELYNTLYKIIQELIRGNLLFKMHISKWFEFILDDVIANNEPCQLDLLKELLRDNSFFVDNFVSKEIIDHLTHHYTKNDSKEYIESKYLQLFRLLCIVGKRVNTNNQKLVLEHFIKKIRGSRYDIQIEESGGEIKVTASLDKENNERLSFDQFYQKCQDSYPSAWTYFVEYLNLIADLAQGRNKVTEAELSKTFTLQVLSELFKLNLHEAEVPIIRMIHYLYVESESFYPIEKKRKILNYNKLAEGEDGIVINSTASKVKPWDEPFSPILDGLIAKLKDYGPIDPEQVDKNATLLTVLKFLWETINLGFWNDKQKVKEILTDVLKIIERSSQITNYEQVKTSSKKNLLMIACKIEGLNIVDLIAEYDNDMFVQYVASRFREFQFPEKRFNLKGININTAILDIRCNHGMVHRFLATLPSAVEPIISTEICDQLIEMTNYDNAELTGRAVSIMDRVLQTRRRAFDQFAELMVISQQERLQLVVFMEDNRSKFFILEDTNIVNVTEENQGCNYFMVYDQSNRGLMEDMYLLTELMKNENSILSLHTITSIHDSGIFGALGSNRLINFTGERSSTNRMKQEIVYSSNLHLKVLTFIFNCKQLPQSELSIKLLHLCYYFIVALIENFNQIKALMQWHIPRMIHHIKRNVGCIDFLKEMYDNNKTMLYNEGAVFQLITEICENIEGEAEDSFYKSKLLDFYRYLIYCNGRSLKNHQIQILKIMQDDSYKNIMVRVTKDQIQQLVQEYEEENRDSQTVKMSPKLTYLCTFFQIMAALIDNNNVVNVGKLLKRYPFQDLVGYLIKAGRCWPLKRNIRCFINRLYYFRPDIDTQLNSIIKFELNNIIYDLTSYIQQKYSPDSLLLQNKKFENPVRFSYIQSYHYLLIEETLFTVFQLVTYEKLKVEMVKYLNEYALTESQKSYNWFKITERLGCLQKFFTSNKNIYSNSLIKFILSKTRLFLDEINSSLYQNQIYRSIPTLQIKKYVIDRLIEGQVRIFFADNDARINQDVPLTFLANNHAVAFQSPTKLRDQNQLKEILRAIFRRQKRDFLNQDERISYNLQQLISSLKLSPDAQSYSFSEYLEKVDTYYSRSDKFEFVGRIIKLNSRDSSALTSQRKMFFLQYVTGLFEAANKPPYIEPVENDQEVPPPMVSEGAEEQGGEEKKDIDQWDPEDWSGNAQEIVKTQKELKRCDLGQFIVQLLKEDIINNVELANSILLCAIGYLLGGNPLTQNNFIEELQKDEDNKVFENIEALIFKLGKLIRKNIDENNSQQQQKSAEFTLDTVDNYDYYDAGQKYTLRKNVFEPNSTDEYLYNKLCITTYRRAFKFLQLLCENNNIVGKHFIRVQPLKARQYNFIDITTKELRNIFEIFCNDIKEVPLFLLDFILEVTQIPIYQNQQALMCSTFFQDLCQLKTTFNNPKLFDERGFKDDKSHVEEIYYKSLKIILSNFQGNDVKTFQVLDSKLEAKFLWDLMLEKLAAMKIGNKGELTKHITDYSNENTEEGGKKIDFSEDILILLDIITIYLKMKDALKEQSRIFASYERSKKEKHDEAKDTIINRLADEGVDEKEREEKAEEELKGQCMYSFLEKCLLNIQITNDKGKDQIIYFPKYPVFSSLTGNLRDFIMRQVKRDSHRDKIVSLLSYTEGVKEKMDYSYNLKKIRKITEQNMNDSFKIASNLSIFLCIYIGIFYHVVIEYQQAEYYSEFTVGAVRFALSLVQLTFTVLYVFYWFELKLWRDPETINRPNPNKEEEQGEDKQAQQTPGQAEADVNPNAAPSRLQVIKNKAYQYFQPLRHYYNVVAEELATQEQRIYKNLQLWRIVVFLGSSIIGTFYFPPMFFLHLIDILAQIQKLGTILYSAIYNAKSLLLVSVMGVFFTFIFCTVTFSNYMKNVYSSSDSVYDMCEGVVDCVAQLYVSGAIGETMESFEIMRFTYDIIYITFFDMLFGNIVGGLMLDAFSSLREEADALESDKKNQCYICGMDREAVEKQGQDFKEHTRVKHFLWNYIFYILVLERKDETDYTGLQYYIRLQYNKPDEEMEVRWIPNKGQSQFDVQAEAQNLSSDLKSSLQTTNSKVLTLQNSITEFKKIAKGYLQ